MKKFTPDELLERLEWRREIRNTMGRISHDLCVKEDAKIYGRYWSRRDDVSLTLNQGTYQGADAVSRYYEALGEEIALSSRLIYEAFPDAFEGKTLDEVYGVGMINYWPLDSYVIEIADDAQTAKAIFNVRGSYCYLTESGPVSNWTYGWAAADFVMEDGQFKVWHMQILYNVDHPCGVSFVDAPKQYDLVPGFEAMKSFHLPEPNVPNGMDYYSATRPYTPSPAVPEPYGTFGDTFSYGV
jgi:hypothetical protein